MKYVFEPDPGPIVPVIDSEDVFPVHRIYCVGKNYADHVREMGSTPERDPPCFFMKPADAATIESQVPYPPGTNNYHYEVELVLAIGKEGRNIAPETVLDYIFGYAVGLDMTRRDLQMASGGLGHPWDTGKGFDDSAPIAAIYPVSAVGHIDSGFIRAEVNGELRQDGNIDDLIWKIDEIIPALSRLFLLRPGDLIFTGTPAGVGPVMPGDKIVASIEGLGELAVEISPLL
ncbi:MAG: fumarylacetoacetate hydrolase family protein [Gammaproteobacteria bacterium]|nr:fumarylacetoacetate hydrolase family protein [Gammaproteobacteria bacterium]